MYRITIEEIVQDESGINAAPKASKLYEQTIAELNLPKIIAAINAKTRIYTKRQVKPA